jgi:formylglycine-generating enzyme required for sulfatase activity
MEGRMTVARPSAVVALLVALGSGSAAWGATPVTYETVTIPAGKMTLSLPQNTYLTIDWLDVRVKIRESFQFGKYEVTNRQWQACVAAGGCEKPLDLREGETLDHPVVRVNWHDARQFSVWLSEVTGDSYRLPTDQEWFYVASLGKGYRADDKEFDYSDLERIRKTPKVTFPVGNFGENEWGAADMVGNVWEWTLSCHAYAEESLRHPDPPSELNNPRACFTRLVGGEHRAHVPDFIRDTYNGGCATLKPAANLGFRLVSEG